MEDKYIKEYYERYDEDGRLLKKDQQIEFLTTTRYLEKYLSKGDRILEVGAGTGRYSIHYAELGYQVDSVELVEHNINILQSKVKDNHDITVNQGNALDLHMYEDNTFDHVLVLGPMYHMYTVPDKQKVIEEALRVCKPNGYVYIAYITHDAVIAHWGLVGGNLAEGIDKNMFTEDYKCISVPQDLFAMFHIDEFNELINPYPINHLHTVGTDGIAPLFDELFENMDDRLYQEWIKYHFATCEKKDLIGYSIHILYIGKKK